jgi:hypothetical protein
MSMKPMTDQIGYCSVLRVAIDCIIIDTQPAKYAYSSGRHLNVAKQPSNKSFTEHLHYFVSDIILLWQAMYRSWGDSVGRDLPPPWIFSKPYKN